MYRKWCRWDHALSPIYGPRNVEYHTSIMKLGVWSGSRSIISVGRHLFLEKFLHVLACVLHSICSCCDEATPQSTLWCFVHWFPADQVWQPLQLQRICHWQVRDEHIKIIQQLVESWNPISSGLSLLPGVMASIILLFVCLFVLLKLTIMRHSAHSPTLIKVLLQRKGKGTNARCAKPGSTNVHKTTVNSVVIPQCSV